MVRFFHTNDPQQLGDRELPNFSLTFVSPFISTFSPTLDLPKLAHCGHMKQPQQLLAGKGHDNEISI